MSTNMFFYACILHQWPMHDCKRWFVLPAGIPGYRLFTVLEKNNITSDFFNKM